MDSESVFKSNYDGINSSLQELRLALVDLPGNCRRVISESDKVESKIPTLCGRKDW
jgi:hypothetical protein